MPISRIPLVSVLLLAMASPAAMAQAQPDAPEGAQDDALEQAVMFGAGMQGAGELCKLLTTDEVAEARKEQKKSFLEMGGTADTFETAYEKAFAGTQKQLAAASAEEREQSCSDLAEMVSEAEAQQNAG